MRTVIIDGDILVYKVPDDCTNCMDIKCEENENAIYRTLEYGSKKGIKGFIDKKIKQIRELTKSDKQVVCISSTTNFRKQLNPKYKSNRREIKPLVYEFVREYLKENYVTFERPDLEADDLIGIITTYPKKLKNIPEGEKVIWSMDKDFKTIPGIFFKTQKDGKTKKITTSQKEADYFWLFQTLIGDPVDGYNGCPNVGRVNAEKILGSVDNFDLREGWQKVVKAFEDRGLTKDDAILQARCSRILRADDYDFKTKEIRLWENRDL